MAKVRQLKERGMEVCGLKLCPGTPYLASGEDNGRVSIWDLRMVKLYTIINAHTACAKVTMISITYTHSIEKLLPCLQSASGQQSAICMTFCLRAETYDTGRIIRFWTRYNHTPAGGPIVVHFYMVTAWVDPEGAWGPELPPPPEKITKI